MEKQYGKKTAYCLWNKTGRENIQYIGVRKGALCISNIGLYAAKSNNSYLSILGRTMGDTAKGAMTENYIAQQSKANGHKFYYWESNNQAELDFVIQIENKIIPIEVKSWEAVRSQSLEIFRKRYNIKKALRISARNFGFENGIKSVPLYAAWCIKKNYRTGSNSYHS